MTGQRTAYSLAEMIVVVLIIGALAFIAVPRLNLAALYHKQANMDAKKIVTDLRRTRTMAISNAVTHPGGYVLQVTGSSSYRIGIINGSIVDTFTIDSTISCIDGTEFRFGPLGNPLSGGGTRLTVSDKNGDRTYTITITPGTGMVKCTGG
jgi:type II secretory pathway pseudopilin PulG